MRYFSYNEHDENSIDTITVSEEEIVEKYYPYWQGRMREKGFDLNNYTFEDCLEDWIVINWAWEIKDEELKSKTTYKDS